MVHWIYKNYVVRIGVATGSIVTRAGNLKSTQGSLIVKGTDILLCGCFCYGYLNITEAKVSELTNVKKIRRMRI